MWSLHRSAPALTTVAGGPGWKQVGELGLAFGLRVVYEDGRGILREILSECTCRGFAIVRVATRQLEHDVAGVSGVAVTLEVQGQPTADRLASGLSDLPGIFEVTATDLASGAD